MTIEERIMARYPSFKASDVRKRKLEYEGAERDLSVHIGDMQPRLFQSPEYLKVDRLATPLQRHTYLDICRYGWAMKALDGFDAVVKVAMQYGLHPNMDEPANADDYVSPIIFYGYLWNALMSDNVYLYSQLPDLRLSISRRSFQISDAQYDALKARNMMAHCSKFEIFFEHFENNSFVEQYKEQGFVVLQNYVRSTAEVVEKAIKAVNPDACLQFDREYGVIIQ